MPLLGKLSRKITKEEQGKNVRIFSYSPWRQVVWVSMISTQPIEE
jgi:hypothetical protein